LKNEYKKEIVMRTMISIPRSKHDTSLWYEMFFEAEERTGVSVDEDLTVYLVHMLISFLKNTDIVLTRHVINYLERVDDLNQTRSLREAGDSCLFVSGIFPKYISRKYGNDEYLIDIGISAYSQASLMDYVCMQETLHKLSQNFMSLVTILRALRKEGRLKKLS